MIKNVKLFCYPLNFWGYLPLSLGYTHVKIVKYLVSSSVKQLEKVSLDFTWGLLSKGCWQFVQMVLRHWTRWLSCPYRVNTWKCFSPELRKLRSGLGGSVGCASDWRPGGREFNPHQGWQHSVVEIGHEIFSTVILCLPLIQERQLSDSG